MPTFTVKPTSVTIWTRKKSYVDGFELFIVRPGPKNGLHFIACLTADLDSPSTVKMSAELRQKFEQHCSYIDDTIRFFLRSRDGKEQCEFLVPKSIIETVEGWSEQRLLFTPNALLPSFNLSLPSHITLRRPGLCYPRPR
jgi:hypothetical protein